MFKKLNTKILLIIFVIFLGAVIVVKLIEPRKERTFKSELVSFKEDEITSISLISKGDKDNKLYLFKEGEDWKAEQAGKVYNADAAKISNMVSQLLNLKPERVAATKRAKWADFEVVDSSSVRVIVKKGSKVLTDLHIGKFTYQNPTSPYQRQGKMTSYVRVDKENETYAVEGFLRMTFNSSANSFRDNKICAANAEDLTRLTFIYPSDSSFTLEKNNNTWLVNGLPADSVKVAGFLNQLIRTSSSDFIDDQPGIIQPSHTLRIEGNNMVAPVEINAIPADSSNMYFITSSINRGTYFSGAKNDLFFRIFKGENYFFNN
ncbi:MAG: DUF4340 domain-containing protein [Bacteroidales bacterium]|nr:DUF4340 domain-containing protein [Bacteroidales bacterium]